MIQLDEKTKTTKGNIPIQKELLNKYSSSEEIFQKASKNFEANIIIPNDIFELKNVDLNNLKISEIKTLAYQIFCNYHYKKEFINDNNKILVARSGINESMEKIYYNRIQRDLLYEHLKVYSCLGKIIENAKLVNQVYEIKGREKYNSWNYYFDGIKIEHKEYLLEFEVVSMSNGKNNYRVQRLELK